MLHRQCHNVRTGYASTPFSVIRIKCQDFTSQSSVTGVRRSASSPLIFPTQAALYRPAPIDCAISAIVVPASYSLMLPFRLTFIILCLLAFNFLSTKSPPPENSRGGRFPRFHPSSAYNVCIPSTADNGAKSAAPLAYPISCPAQSSGRYPCGSSCRRRFQQASALLCSQQAFYLWNNLPHACCQRDFRSQQACFSKESETAAAVRFQCIQWIKINTCRPCRRQQALPPVFAGQVPSLSATRDSVVRTIVATDAAFWSAERVTFVGSTMPMEIMSP